MQPNGDRGVRQSKALRDLCRSPALPEAPGHNRTINLGELLQCGTQTLRSLGGVSFLLSFRQPSVGRIGIDQLRERSRVGHDVPVSPSATPSCHVEGRVLDNRSEVGHRHVRGRKPLQQRFAL